MSLRGASSAVSLLSVGLLGAGLLAVPLAAFAGAGGAAAAGPTCFGRHATIVGTPGNDHLVGTNGADVIVSLGGHDYIKGRGGDDFICAGGGYRSDKRWATDDVIYGGWGNDHIRAGGGRHDLVYGGPGDDVLQGGAGFDRLYGQAGHDVLYGGSGSDGVLDGGPGRDVVHGGRGNDQAFDTSNDGRRDIFYGNRGNDTFHGLSGPNIAYGGDGNDTLLGGNGSERLVGGAGADLLSGDDGNDALVGGTGRDKAGFTENLLSYRNGHYQRSAETRPIFVDLSAGVARGAGHDTLTGIEDVSTGQGNDTLIGDDGPNVLSSSPGPLFGADTADTFDGKGGSDTVMLGAGADDVTIDLAAGTGQSRTCNARDLQTGSCTGHATETAKLTSIENALAAGDNNHVYGDHGDNRLGIAAEVNQHADNAIDGRAGVDTLVFGLESAGVAHGPAGPPYLHFEVDLAAGSALMRLNDGDRSWQTDLTSIENVTGSTYQFNVLRGDAGPNVLVGGVYDDVLRGGAGDDVLFGGSGNDRLYGWTGSDALHGGPGTDRCADPDPDTVRSSCES